MSPETEKEIVILAGEYLLGTLEEGERARFETRLKEDPEVRQALAFWEDRFGDFPLMVPPVEVPHRVWNAIELGLDGKGKGGLIRNFWDSIRFWRPLALGAVAAMVALVLIYRQPQVSPPVQPAPLVAMVGAADQPPVYLLAAYPESRKAMVRVLHPMEVPEGKVMELWMLRGEGRPPMSCGRLPSSGEMVMDMEDPAMPYFKAGATLAVSLEPSGGSAGEGPSGPVLYQGKLQPI